MLHSMITRTMGCLKLTCYAAVAVTIATAAFNMLKMLVHSRHISWLMGLVITIPAVIPGIYDRVNQHDMYARVFSFLQGLLIFTALLIIYYEKDKSVRILAFFSCLLLFVQLLGSDNLYPGGKYACWLCLLVTLNYFSTLK